jgi:hypothetical protein
MSILLETGLNISVEIIKNICQDHDLLYNNRPVPCENVSEKEPVFTDEGATVRALLKNKNAEK